MRAIHALVSGIVAACSAVPALGTWSIILIDTRTGEVAMGSATCTDGDLGEWTAVLLTGVGGATAQSWGDDTGQNRVFLRDAMLRGASPEEIVTLLEGFDAGHQTRQYGIADVRGRAATFSGSECGGWAGGELGEFPMSIAGRTGTVVYAIQGNVLTGEPVVAEAVRAAIETPGDLPERLMLSMEAARLMGGDGRCSCDPADPERCGSPPEDFEKSSQVSFMLIARAGDRDGGNGVYRVGTDPTSAVAADFNGDLLPDIATADVLSDGVSIVLQAPIPGSPFITYAPSTPIPVANATRCVVAADFDGDGRMDLATADNGASRLSVLRGNGDGTFAAPVALAVASGPQRVAAGDVNGDGRPDLVYITGVSGRIGSFLNDGSGGFTAATPLTLGGQPRGLDLTDIDGDGLMDAAVAVRDRDAAALVRSLGDGTFEVATEHTVGDQPLSIASADFDGDGDTDLATAELDARTMTILVNRGGSFDSTTVALPGRPFDVIAQDADGDGTIDLLGPAGRQFVLLRGKGDGTFEAPRPFAMFTGASSIGLSDLDLDGDLDAFLASSQSDAAVIVENRGEGEFNDGGGAATGDYYMDLKVADATTADPDPVLTIRTQYDQFRADHVGRPDAIASAATFDRPRLPADGKSISRLTIEVRDWAVSPVGGGSVTVEHARGSDGISAIGDVVDLGGGRYAVAVTSGMDRGRDRFVVTVDDGVRPVVLMPEPGLRLTVNPDFNGDGRVNVRDWVSFQDAWRRAEVRADLNEDGEHDILDFVELHEAFIGG